MAREMPTTGPIDAADIYFSYPVSLETTGQQYLPGMEPLPGATTGDSLRTLALRPRAESAIDDSQPYLPGLEDATPLLFDQAAYRRLQPVADSFSRADKIRRVSGQTLHGIGTVAAGLTAAYFSLRGLGTVHEVVGPVHASARLEVGTGEGRLNILGLGDATTQVSQGPFGISFSSDRIDNSLFGESKNNAPQVKLASLASKNYADKALTQLNRLQTRAEVNGGLALGLGGLAGIAIYEAGFFAFRDRRMDKQSALRIGALALGLPVMTLGIGAGNTLMTLNHHAFDKIHFDNPAVEQLYTFIASSQNEIATYKQKSAELNTFLNNLITIRDNLDRGLTSAPSENLMPILLYGDRHSRPCTYNRLLAIVSHYGIVAALDMGDETEWGSKFETSLFTDKSCPNDNPGLLRIPVKFVTGNHDGSVVAEEMAQYPNVQVLNTEGTVLTLNWKGQKVSLRIAGGGDPRFTPDGLTRKTNQQDAEAITVSGTDMAKLIENYGPNFVMVHSPEEVAAILNQLNLDKYPLGKLWLLNGHTHVAKIDQKNQEITVGSVGAGGLRGYQNDQSLQAKQVEATIMYVNPVTKLPEYADELFLNSDGSFGSTMIKLQQPANNQVVQAAGK